MILFLHGIPDSGRVWDDVAARLAVEHSGLAPDLPGFGANGVPTRPHSLADLRALMDGVVGDLPLPDRFTLVVHDVGGLFGLSWAVARRRRVARLVILNTSIFPDRRWHWGARLLRMPLLGEAAMRVLPRRGFRAEMRRAANGNLTDAAIDGVYDRFGRTARATALALYRRQTPGLFGDLPDAVRALTATVPTLVIWGRNDPYLPPSFAGRFGARAVRLLDGIGHWPQREAPDQTAAAIGAFLASPGLRAE